jgi:hypothetical protein
MASTVDATTMTAHLGTTFARRPTCRRRTDGATRSKNITRKSRSTVCAELKKLGSASSAAPRSSLGPAQRTYRELTLRVGRSSISAKVCGSNATTRAEDRLAFFVTRPVMMPCVSLTPVSG